MCVRVLCLTPSSPCLSLSNGPITVLIEASSALGAAPVILASEMYNDVHSIPAGGSRGDSAPLKIQCLVMQGTIRQSSSLPCDTGNTINVALTLNRPLALACLPSITITGLFGVSYDQLMHKILARHTRPRTRKHKNTRMYPHCIRWVFESTSGIFESTSGIFESVSLYVHAIHPVHRSPHLVICVSLLCMCFAFAILSHFMYECLSQMSSIDASTCVLRACVSLLPPSLLSSACAFLDVCFFSASSPQSPVSKGFSFLVWVST